MPALTGGVTDVTPLHGPGLPANPVPRPGRRTVRLGLMIAAAAVAVVVAACSSAAGGAPSFTYAPPAPSASTMPGMDMSPAPSPPAMSAAPAASGPASAAPVPPGSPVAAGATLHIAAQNIQFDTDHLEAPAGQAFVLEFANNDPGIPHNVEIRDATGASMFKGQIINGPAKASYQVPALPAGSYMFLCDVHPNMTGTLTVT
jgi:plastocyanin